MKKIPKEGQEKDSVPFVPAFSLSVDLPINNKGKADVFIDNITENRSSDEGAGSDDDSTDTVQTGSNKKLVIHLQRSKVSARIPIRENRKISGHTLISDHYATVVYSERKHINDNNRLLETFSCNMLNNMKYVPFPLKSNDPELFGHMLNQSIVAMNNIRNVAICGISPEVMDAYLQNEDSLFDKLSKIEGVQRVDPHRRTVDLGK